jgi:transcription antitermination factor NusG
MGWYVLQVSPRSEKKVARVCDTYGLPYYLPLREDRRVYQRRKVVFHKPLFPGYLFVDLQPDTRVHVLRTNHVLRMFKPADEEQLIHEIAQIRLALLAEPQLSAAPGLHEGARVRIIAGVFAGVEGVVDRCGHRSLVRLNVEMVGQSVPVEVDPDYLEILDTIT